MAHAYIASTFCPCHNPVPNSATHTWISRNTTLRAVIPDITCFIILLGLSTNFSSCLEYPPLHPCPFGKFLLFLQVSSKVTQVILVEEMLLDTSKLFFLDVPTAPFISLHRGPDHIWFYLSPPLGWMLLEGMNHVWLFNILPSVWHRAWT